MSLTVNIESVHQFFSASTGELTTTLVLDVFGHRVEVPVVDDALRSVVEAVVSGKSLPEPLPERSGGQSPQVGPLPMTKEEYERRQAQVALQKLGEDYRRLQTPSNYPNRESTGRNSPSGVQDFRLPLDDDPTIPKIEDPGQIYPPDEPVTQVNPLEGLPVKQAPEPVAEAVATPLDDDMFEAG